MVQQGVPHVPIPHALSRLRLFNNAPAALQDSNLQACSGGGQCTREGRTHQ